MREGKRDGVLCCYDNRRPEKEKDATCNTYRGVANASCTNVTLLPNFVFYLLKSISRGLSEILCIAIYK